jgi:hypothetical protein
VPVGLQSTAQIWGGQAPEGKIPGVHEQPSRSGRMSQSRGLLGSEARSWTASLGLSSAERSRNRFDRALSEFDYARTTDESRVRKDRQVMILA